MKNYWNTDFNYDDYKGAQESLNKQKIDTVWVQDNEIKIMSDYLKDFNPCLKYGLCHGSRNGSEVQSFIKYLDINVLGTDISSTANNFPNIIQWDMHEVKEGWKCKFDFIYSNAIDHSYDVPLCLRRWLSCLSEGGVVLLHFGHFGKKTNVTPGDCFTATEDEHRYIINNEGVLLDIIQLEKSRVVWVVGNKKEAQNV